MRASWIALVALLPALAFAQGKDSVTVGMTLEPPGLDPTIAPAAAIGEVTHLNIFEGLTRIKETGEVAPLLAESWTISPDLKTWTFKLRQNVKFHDGTLFDSADVKSAFERYASEKSTNKRKPDFANMETIGTPDAHTVAITLKQPAPNLLFHLGENTAVITAPESFETNATKPVGTGPFKFDRWVKGDSVALAKAETYRDPASIRLNRVTFRFIPDASAQIAALLAGDLDVYPTFGAPEAVEQFRKDARFTVTVGTTEGETLLAVNNKRKPFDDVRVRRALSHAIDKQAVIDGAMYGFGTPIGSHFAPHHPAHVDLAGQYKYDPAKAKALLEEAGVKNLEVSLKLPPPPYARRGGEIVAAQLAAIGIKANLENVEWAVWLDGAFKNKNYDLTIVSHVEPLDIVRYTDPSYYFQYDSAAFRAAMDKANSTADEERRYGHLREAQKQLADDAVNVWLFQLAKIVVAKKGLTGLWRNAPIFANDMSAVRWQ